MTDFFNEQGSPDDFAMPGDEAVLAQIRGDEPEQAAPEAAAEPAAEAEPENTEADERPRNPDGTFAKKQQEEEPQEELILGKFKTAEDLARAYQELELFKGRQQSEIGELRQALEERLESFEQRVQQPVTPHTPVTQDLIDSNPALATQLAWQQGNIDLARAALEQWKIEEPFDAAIWVGEVRQAQREAERQRELEELRAQVAPVQQQAQQNELKNELTVGISRLREQYPDLADFVQSPEFVELAEQIPLAKKALAEGTPSEGVSAIETLYLIHRGRASDNLKDAAKEVARSAAVEAQQMREEAFVASASATTTAPPRSRADELAAGWDEKDSLFESNWNV